MSTIFITVPASPTTEALYALSDGSAATVGIEALANGVAQVTSTAITKTVTATVVSTQAISVIQASSPSEDQALYSFAEDNGTTTWLGATPPASASLITSTQVVTVQPVPPGYVAPPVEATPVTSYLTLSSTETLTETHTETQTLTVPTASASAGAYTGLASNGWNSSTSKIITVKSPAVGSVTNAENLAQYPGTAYPMVSSGLVPVPRGNTTHLNKARDIADTIVVTIDGVVVSWTNSYDGTDLSSSDTSPIVAPVTATAPLLKPGFSRKCPLLETGHRLIATVGLWVSESNMRPWRGDCFSHLRYARHVSIASNISMATAPVCDSSFELFSLRATSFLPARPRHVFRYSFRLHSRLCR